jgi:hypothetical protein
LAFPSKASCGAVLFAAAQALAGPVQSIRIGPIDAVKADVTMVLAANRVKKCAGQFRGHLLFYGKRPPSTVLDLIAT